MLRLGWGGVVLLACGEGGDRTCSSGGPAATAPAQSYKMPHGPWFVTRVFIVVIRWHPGETEPPASVSRSSAGGETLKERARLNCCLQMEFPEA